MEKKELNRKLHVGFWRKHLAELPEQYAPQESNRLTLLYFVICALDLLDSLPVDEERKKIIDWVYAQQILPPEGNREDDKENLWTHCGFRGSPFYGHPYADGGSIAGTHDHNHIAMVYTALAILRVLGDDFGRLNKQAILDGLKFLRNDDGSFRPHPFHCEADMRYVYCAAAISYFLCDWSAMDVPKTTEYIFKSRSYEDIFSQGPGEEGHGGSTYCALATLALTGQIDKIPEKDNTVRWLLERQSLGFQGRPNKDPDTCYSFWVGGSLSMLGSFSLVDAELLRAFIYQCEYKYGGFAKCPNHPPDVLHAYYSLCGLSACGEDDLPPVFFPLGISQRAADSLPPCPPAPTQ